MRRVGPAASRTPSHTFVACQRTGNVSRSSGLVRGARLQAPVSPFASLPAPELGRPRTELSAARRGTLLLLVRYAEPRRAHQDAASGASPVAHVFSREFCDAKQPHASVPSALSGPVDVPLHREFGNTKLVPTLLGVPQIVLGLLIEPAFSRCAERHG